MTDEQRAKISATLMGHVFWGEEHHSAETRAKQSAALIGQKLSEETKAKMSVAQSNRSPERRANLSASLMGHVESLETRAKISAARMGQKGSPESHAKTAAGCWKGGKVIVSKRHHAKRRGLGYAYLNEQFAGCEGHHVDNEQVINMPKALHRSIYHRQTDGRGMAKINAIAYNFLFGQEVVAALKEA